LFNGLKIGPGDNWDVAEDGSLWNGSTLLLGVGKS
jgi:hypothetical protein